MSPLQKGILGIATVSGAGTATGVPLGLTIGRRGGHSELQKISLTECERGHNLDLVEVEYGSPIAKKICGNLLDGRKEEMVNKSGEFTEFLQDNGSRQGEEWGGSVDRGWTEQCIGNGVSSQGAITSPNLENNYQYIGLCEDSDKTSAKFLRKKKESDSAENKNYFRIGACENNCGTNEREILEVKTLNKENEDNGKEVKFYTE